MKSKILLLFTGLACLSSCGKDFLETEPSKQLSGKRLGEITQKIPEVGNELSEGQISGLYSWMVKAGSGGTKMHMDFGQKGIDLVLDVTTGDLIKSGNPYGQYELVQRYQSQVVSTNLVNYMIWRYYYRLIFTANSIMDIYGGENAQFADDAAGQKARAVIGQCLGVRAHSLFYLAQALSSEYSPSEKLFPIYTDLKTVNKSKATQEEIYAQVIKDFERSAELLSGYKRANKQEFASEIAYAYLAYTYGAMGNWAEMEKYSNMVVKNGAYTPMTPSEIVYNEEKGTGSGFNNVNISGWIWGTDLTEDMKLDLISWWGQMDIYAYSYARAGAPKVMNNVLYNSIREDDIRRGQFVDISKEMENPAFVHVPVNKFYGNSQRVFKGQDDMNTGDYVYLRVSEMILLHVEALARLGREEEAKAELKTFLTGRIGDLSYIDALVGESLLKEIYQQIRIELWGEGKSYLAMKRFKPTTIELGTNRFDSEWQGKTKSYSDVDMYFKVPQNEIINNPNLDK